MRDELRHACDRGPIDEARCGYCADQVDLRGFMLEREWRSQLGSAVFLHLEMRIELLLR
jgi:hypothetical protein